MKLGLVLTSCNRHADLERFFDSLVDQGPDNEVVVVFCDQGDSRHVVQQYDSRLNIIYVKIDRMPLSCARNIGLGRLADADVVAFPDDDCWYSEKFVERISKKFGANKDVDAFCVSVYDPVVKRRYGNRPPNVSASVGFGNIFSLPISVGIFVRSAALDKAGKYFNEYLGAGTALGSGEETELVSRLLESGARIRYDGSLDVYHPYPPFSDDEHKKNLSYGIGFGSLSRYLVGRGHYTVLLFALRTIATSLMGAVVYSFRPNLRRAYVYRAVGIAKGLFTPNTSAAFQR